MGGGTTCRLGESRLNYEPDVLNNKLLFYNDDEGEGLDIPTTQIRFPVIAITASHHHLHTTVVDKSTQNIPTPDSSRMLINQQNNKMTQSYKLK